MVLSHTEPQVIDPWVLQALRSIFPPVVPRPNTEDKEIYFSGGQQDIMDFLGSSNGIMLLTRRAAELRAQSADETIKHINAGVQHARMS